MPKQDTGKTPFSKLRRRRSEKLTRVEHGVFKKYVDGFPTQLDAVEHLKFNSRQTFSNIYRLGSGHPDNIKKIRDAVKDLIAKDEDIIVEVEGERTALAEFIIANSNEGVSSIEEEELDELRLLEIGKIHYIGSHAGYTAVKRIA